MKNKLNIFLFLPLSNDGKNIKDSYIVVKEAHIGDAIAEKTERVADYGVVFTTRMCMSEVKDKLRIKKGEKYLLIELNENVTSETISGFFPDTNIEEIRCLNLENLKESAEFIEREMYKAGSNQEFEKAAKLRDRLKNKIKSLGNEKK